MKRFWSSYKKTVSKEGFRFLVLSQQKCGRMPNVTAALPNMGSALCSTPQVGCLPYFDTWCGPSANLECRSERCCTRLAANAGRKKIAKNRHLGTFAQLCRAISSQLRHVSTIGKKLLSEQHLIEMSPQYGELRPTSG